MLVTLIKKDFTSKKITAIKAIRALCMVSLNGTDDSAHTMSLKDAKDLVDSLEHSSQTIEVKNNKLTKEEIQKILDEGGFDFEIVTDPLFSKIKECMFEALKNNRFDILSCLMNAINELKP